MRTSTIREQAVHIIRMPVILLSLSLVVVVFVLLGFAADAIHIVLFIVGMTTAFVSAVTLAKSLAHRIADTIGASFGLLKIQIDGILLADRDLVFNSDLTESMELAESVRKLSQRTAEVQEEMKRLEHVRSQFLANVSHELRTPVFAIQGYLETLMEGAENDESVRHLFLEKASANAIRLNVLLGDLIDISRIESGEMRMSFRYFNIVDVAREVCSALEGMADYNSVKLFVDASDEDISVLGDKERIIQVLSNLVSNAIRYNKIRGTVHVEIRRNDAEIVVSVIDTGIGISPEHQSRIFERFYRADANRSRSTGGSGLGLAIVKHILEAHDSTPLIESVENVGTTISFSLRR